MNNDKQEVMQICFEECKGILRALAVKYKAIYNGDVEEAFADACLWLMEFYDSFDRNKATFVTYAYSVIENKFINAGKKAYKEKQHMSNVSIEDLDKDGLLVYGSNKIILDEGMTKGQSERYNIYFQYCNDLEILTEREQTIFKLFYYDNWNIKDIASQLGLSEIRIKEIKSKIIKKLDKNSKNM